MHLNSIKDEFYRRLSNIHRCSDIPVGVLRDDTRLHHRGIGVILSRGVVLGSNVFIGQYVTIGNTIKDGQVFSPVIEDNVLIYPYSIIIGDVTIGHDSVVGAGAVVFKDVPPHSLVVEYSRIYVGKYKVDEYTGDRI